MKKMKTIDQILSLSTNPHYNLSEEELDMLLDHQEKQYKNKNKKNEKSFKKETGSFKKHESESEE